MLAALGEDNAQRLAGNFRILKEQFIKIAHAVKQQAVGIRRLDLQKLGDHRRGIGGGFLREVRHINCLAKLRGKCTGMAKVITGFDRR